MSEGNPEQIGWGGQSKRRFQESYPVLESMFLCPCVQGYYGMGLQQLCVDPMIPIGIRQLREIRCFSCHKLGQLETSLPAMVRAAVDGGEASCAMEIRWECL